MTVVTHLPFTYRICSFQPQYELVLIVQDQDTVCIAYVNYCYTYQEPVDEIYINFAVHPSSNFTVINATTGRYQRGTITISVRLTCSPHWYGQDCGTFCMPQNNSKFICNNDGNKACLKGWNGTNCSEGTQQSHMYNLLICLSPFFI